MERKDMFCNPVTFSDGKRHTNPDPYILRWCGKYYCYATDEYGVKVCISEDLTCWTDRGYAIKEEEYRNYWAPAVIYINGGFYLFYSNVPKESEECHDECLKLAVSDNAEGPFVWKKTFFSKFSIDPHPLMWSGKLHLFYSVNDWIGTEMKRAGTCIVVDEMKTPECLKMRPRDVVLPSLKQEIYEENRFGDGRDWYTIEGAAPIVRGKYFWLLYSANAYVNEDYFVGTAVAECREKFKDMIWRKYPSEELWYPLLKKNNMVEGTGHNTVEKSPNMMEDWIIYHGRKAEEKINPHIEQREMYIEPLYFSGKRIVCFGPTTQLQEKPGIPDVEVRDKLISANKVICRSSEFYIAETWVSAVNNHGGMRYGIAVDYINQENYIEIQICSGKNRIRVIQSLESIQMCMIDERLEKTFNHTVPHLIRIQKIYNQFEIQIDYTTRLSFVNAQNSKNEKLRVVSAIPYFSRMHLHSFILTKGIILEAERLCYLSKLYQVSQAIVDKSGLYSIEKKIKLERTCHSSDFTEEFQFETTEKESGVYFEWEEGGTIVIDYLESQFSVYYIRRGNREWLIIDGKKKEVQTRNCVKTQLRIFLENIKITEYRLTKKSI